MEAKKTPLYQWHVEHGGKMVDFAGWMLPMSYTGIIDEHNQVRNSGGVFDVSHMGRLKIKGRHARRLLERACTRRISDMEPGQCRYSLVLNDKGGIRDDVLVYRLDADEFMMVVNASNRAKIVSHLNDLKAAGEFNLKIDDQTDSTAMIAIQGPNVMQLAGKVSSEVPTLKRYRFVTKNLVVIKLMVSRTGYTGENGVEVILPAAATGMALKLMMKDINMSDAEALMKPAGLGARDTLRLEAGMPLYGHELTEETNALGTGLDFAISMDKDQDENGEPFVGLEALRKTQAEGGPKRKLVGLEIKSPRTARQDMPVFQNGTEVGLVTSGCKSPTLNKSIAMAYVDAGLAEVGTSLVVKSGSNELPVTVVPMPFYKAPKN